MPRKVVTQQVEGGQWQARYEDGEPNQFGSGSSPGDAEQQLLESTLQGVADLNASPKVQNRKIVVKKLRQEIEVKGKPCTHVAYEESNPGEQSYGSDENDARVAFLTQQKSSDAKSSK